MNEETEKKEIKEIKEIYNKIINNIRIKYFFIIINDKIKYDIRKYLKYIFIYNILNNSNYIEKLHHHKYLLYYDNHNIYIEIINKNKFKNDINKLKKRYYNKEIKKLREIFNDIIEKIEENIDYIYEYENQTMILNKIQEQLIQFRYFYNKEYNLKYYFIDLILVNLYNNDEMYKYDKIEDINDIINFKDIIF